MYTPHLYSGKFYAYKTTKKMNEPYFKGYCEGRITKKVDYQSMYPISNSKWVSPVVITPKNNGKWRICVYFRELNKATLKDYFPLPLLNKCYIH